MQIAMHVFRLDFSMELSVVSEICDISEQSLRTVRENGR